VRSRGGEGIFIVHGSPPLSLEAQLSQLAACIGQPSADFCGLQSPGIDKDLLAHAREVALRPLTRAEVGGPAPAG
jgi:hypothetical protein